MLIGDILARNARMYGNEVALIEREPAKNRRVEITWREFDDQANRFANGLIAKGIKKGDKVIHLMMNCIEWLPSYFGILRTGAWAVPLNFRFSAQDIKLCAGIAEGKAMIFGEEFIDRINEIKGDLSTIKDYIFLGPDEIRCDYAEKYEYVLEKSFPVNPDVEIGIEDEAGLYFTSGTT
ncbi:MAG: long-chain fatty acid--CoA ligase, partial [Deltaproteobacteria bacterium]